MVMQATYGLSAGPLQNPPGAVPGALAFIR
jgi:hypothetical protein